MLPSQKGMDRWVRAGCVLLRKTSIKQGKVSLFQFARDVFLVATKRGTCRFAPFRLSKANGIIYSDNAPGNRMTQPQSIDDLLQRLNPQQREAATHGDSPLLIVAGAGTAKLLRSSTAWPGSSHAASIRAASCF